MFFSFDKNDTKMKTLSSYIYPLIFFLFRLRWFDIRMYKNRVSYLHFSNSVRCTHRTKIYASVAQLVVLASGVVLGGVAEVVGSNLARGKIFTASIGSVDSLYPSVYIYINRTRTTKCCSMGVLYYQYHLGNVARKPVSGVSD